MSIDANTAVALAAAQANHDLSYNGHRMARHIVEFYATSAKTAIIVANQLVRDSYSPNCIARQIRMGGVTHDYVLNLINSVENDD